MELSWVGFLLLYLVGKAGETLLEMLLIKFWEKVLSDDNLKQLTRSLKLQILILYLNWLLKRKPTL